MRDFRFSDSGLQGYTVVRHCFHECDFFCYIFSELRPIDISKGLFLVDRHDGTYIVN